MDLNRRLLEEELNIDHNGVIWEPSEPVEGEGEDPDEIIRKNIDRANRILDRIEEEMVNGNFSSRLAEVAAKCMDSITNAVSQIQSTTYNNDYLQLKSRVVDLKKSELEFKVNNSNKPQKVGSQNIIFTDRESLLKALENKRMEDVVNG